MNGSLWCVSFLKCSPSSAYTSVGEVSLDDSTAVRPLKVERSETTDKPCVSFLMAWVRMLSRRFLVVGNVARWCRGIGSLFARAARGLRDTWLHHEYEALAVRGPVVALDVIGCGSQRPRLSAATIEKDDLALVRPCRNGHVGEVAAIEARPCDPGRHMVRQSFRFFS